jgi:hypothetical protein
VDPVPDPTPSEKSLYIAIDNIGHAARGRTIPQTQANNVFTFNWDVIELVVQILIYFTILNK